MTTMNEGAGEWEHVSHPTVDAAVEWCESVLRDDGKVLLHCADHWTVVATPKRAVHMGRHDKRAVVEEGWERFLRDEAQVHSMGTMLFGHPKNRKLTDRET